MGETDIGHRRSSVVMGETDIGLRRSSVVMGETRNNNMCANGSQQGLMNKNWSRLNQVVRRFTPTTEHLSNISPVDDIAVQQDMLQSRTSITRGVPTVGNGMNSLSNDSRIQCVVNNSTDWRAEVVDHQPAVDVDVDIDSASDDHITETTTFARKEPSFVFKDRSSSGRHEVDHLRIDQDEMNTTRRHVTPQRKTCHRNDDIDITVIRGIPQWIGQQPQPFDDRNEQPDIGLVAEEQAVRSSTQTDERFKLVETSSRSRSPDHRDRYQEVSSSLIPIDRKSIDAHDSQRQQQRRKHANTSRSQSTSRYEPSTIASSTSSPKKAKHKRNCTSRRKSTDSSSTRQDNDMAENSDSAEESEEKSDDEEDRDQHQHHHHRHHHLDNNGHWHVHGTQHRGRGSEITRGRNNGNDRLMSETFNSNSIELSGVHDSSSHRCRHSTSRREMPVNGYDGWHTSIIGRSIKIPVRRTTSNDRTRTGSQTGHGHSPDSAAIAMIQQMPPPSESERKQQRNSGNRFTVARKVGVNVLSKPYSTSLIPAGPASGVSMVTMVTTGHTSQVVGLDATDQISGVVIDKRDRFASSSKVSVGSSQMIGPLVNKRIPADDWNTRKVTTHH